MQGVFVNISSDKFSLNGIEYHKSFIVVKSGESTIRVVSVYDSRYRLLNSTRFDEIQVDGNTYNNLVDLINALSAIVYSKTSVNVNEVTSDNIKNALGYTPSNKIIVNSIAELRNLGYAPSNNQSIHILGFNEAGDGGESEAYFDASSSESDNGLTCLQITGITNGRVKRKIKDRLNLKWFGAKLDKTTDDTQAFQSALDLYKSAPFEIFLDGYARITGPLVYQTSGNSSGLRLIGSGIESSGIIGDFTGDELIKIDGSSLDSGKFQYGGGFENLQLTTTGAAQINNCLHIIGWWKASHKNLLIGTRRTPSFTGNGIYLPLRTDISSNVDFYASVGWKMENVTIDSMGQNGILGDNNQGYAGWLLKDCAFEENGIDGIQVHCANWRVVNGSCSYNGRYGINYSGLPGVTLTNGYFSGVELDGNGSSNLFVRRVSSGIFINCRSISRLLDGTERALNQVHISDLDIATGLVFQNWYHRTETNISSPVTLYYCPSVSPNVLGNKILGYNVLESGTGGISEFSEAFLRNDFRNEIKNQFNKTINSAFTKYTHSSKSNQSITTTQTVWKFATSIANTGWTDYNTTTGELTVPYSGLYNFNIDATIQSITAGERIRILITVNAVVTEQFYLDFGPNDQPDRTSFTWTPFLVLNKGDVVSITIDRTGTASFFGLPKLTIYNF